MAIDDDNGPHPLDEDVLLLVFCFLTCWIERQEVADVVGRKEGVALNPISIGVTLLILLEPLNPTPLRAYRMTSTVAMMYCNSSVL